MAVRHPNLYLEDGNIIFLVENTLYRVHRHFFVRQSPVFRDMLSVPSGSDKEEGLSDDAPIRLPVESLDFERFLWLFYNETYEQEALAVEWTSIIELAVMWQFTVISEFAFRKFCELPQVPSIEALELRNRHNFSHLLARDVYMRRCQTRYSLHYAEGNMIGWESCVLISLGLTTYRDGSAGTFASFIEAFEKAKTELAHPIVPSA
ncbi:hypothetical protein FIBSPDRAFT_833449 [Athelia psychrophila]|uniref:BTB domain-containing protein n=1 Tax=Athelia psychrophila TaxID=1759441 RepID=A0A166DUB7_9AGAM|nr:hypothetical protein FIBSPDRAFT_838480 [Fibularhizoctonia sp. CBS 109695]KZP15078.1 hypothetical protein FIBSPDRAFT_833449 [Fibularhizoctonia sp. CBS 109695]